MPRVLALLLLSVTLCVAAGATEIPSLPLGMWDFGGSAVPLAVSRTSPDHTTIVLENPSVVMEDRLVDFETYQSFSIPGEPVVMEDGSPAVPQVSRFYRIPNTGSVELVITNSEFELVQGVNPLPVKFEGSESFDRVRRSPVYDQDQWYPPVSVEMSEPMVFRDFRVVRVTLFPVQVNPVTHEARLYSNLSADVVANDTPGANEITHSRPISKSWLPIYQNMIPNLDDAALDNISETPGSIMIICDTDNIAQQWADSLRNWKKRKGFDVIIDARNNWNVGTMTSAIQTAFSTWDPPLEFVALIGEPNASFGVPTDGTNYDHGFALGNSGDDLEDIGVGRLCGSSGSEMATINAKIMGYERNPFMTDTTWFHRGFFYAGTGHSIASNWTMIQWASHQFANQTQINDNTEAQHSGGVIPGTIQSELNTGVAIFLWRGSWVGEMGTDVANGCNNGWKLPITLTITCGTGAFGGSVANSWLVAGTANNPKGGVTAMGTATLSTHAPYNITVAGGLAYNIADLGVEHIGHAVNGAKAWLYYLWASNYGTADDFAKWNNLLGDPSLSIWTDVPTVIEATHSSTINVGARSLSLTVTETGSGTPVADALVCLWKGDETYERGLTDAAGQVTLPLTINTEGELLVTVTKRNHKPYLASVACAPAAQMVTLSSYTMDDDNSGGTSGNANGVLNPGETIDLPVYLRNFGNSETATSISATLTSSNPRVSVVNGASTFANLAPGDSAISAAPFRIQVSSDMQHDEVATLTFTVTASIVQTLSTLELTCVAGAANYISHQFSGPVNPGSTNNLRVTLRNTGEVELTNATAQIVSLSPFVQVDDAAGVFGNIAPDQQVTNAGDEFTLTSNTLTFRGHQAPMRMIVSTSNGFVDTVQFTVSIGAALSTDPTGPDAYGYYAYDNTDVSYETCPTFEYVNISAGMGESLSLSNDPGEKTTPNPIHSTVRDLPFPFTFYGVSYDEVTICTNGWLAFGDQGWNDFFRNYPIPAMQAPDAMVAAYWDDLKTQGGGLGVWQYYDEVNHKYIVQWKTQVYTGGTSLDFEVILLDEEFYPTFDGNGQVLVQYSDATMGASGDFDEPNGCSIGIQAPGGTVGLSYAFLTSYAPGSATVGDGRAILFTTNARMLFGEIHGTVLDAANSQPMPGVDVTIEGYSYHILTDNNGQYILDNVLIGTYTVHVHKRGYNDANVANILVELDSVETVNFSMLHPELELSRDTIAVSLPTEPNETTFDIVNDGNGPLDYSIEITYAGDDSPSPWDYLDGINLTEATGDFMMQGCEFVGDYWWVTGGSGQGGGNFLYKFDTDGNYVGSIPQPSSSQFGWFDMAYDGQYLYGSEQLAAGLITGIDLTGQVQTTVPSPVNPSRAIAYDPTTDHFWVADFGSDIFEINRQGTVIQQITNEGDGELDITGMAWHALDPDGYRLFIFCQNGTGTQTQLWRMHPVSHDLELITTLEATPGDRAGGLAMTPGWNSTLLVLGGILQNPAGDRLGIYEVTFNTTWIDVSPTITTVPGGSTQEVSIDFDPTFLRPDEYRVNLNIHSDVLDTTYVLPVVLLVTSSDVPESGETELPQTYALYQNYPNPFNPSTTIRYDLKADGRTRLAVYNLMGQEIAVLVDQMQNAGSHQLTFDASALPSGMYFYRLQSGDFVHSAKMVLMK